MVQLAVGERCADMLRVCLFLDAIAICFDSTLRTAGTLLHPENRLKYFTFHNTALAALALTGFAQATMAADPTALEPVVVTATRNPTPADAVLAAVTVIDRTEIEQSQAIDLAQLLSTHAGLDIGRTGGPGQPASIFIRGGNSDHTLVLIDGVRVNPSSFGGAALSLIAPEMIERIEIVKGPRSTLYGSDALAGVINIITRAPGNTRFGLRAGGGSYGTRDLAASTSVGDEHARLTITGQKIGSQGFPSFVGATEDRGYDLGTVALRGEASAGPVRFKAQVWRAEGSNEYASQQLSFGGPPDFATVLAGFDARDHDTLNQTAAVSAEFSPLAQWQTRVQFSHSTDRVSENQSAAALRSLRPELRIDNVIELGAQRFSVGASAAQDRVDVSNSDNIHDVRDSGAIYAQGEFIYGRNSAVLGGSWNRYDGFDGEPTMNVEYGFQAWQGAKLIASYGTGFKAPNANQRFTAFGGNPDLKPERSRSYELGMQQRYGAHRVELRAFRNDVRDLIVFNFDPTQADFGDNLNLNRARTQGIELAYSGQIGPFETRLEGVLQSAKDCSADDNGSPVSRCEDGARLKRRNSRSISGAITWRQPRYFIGVDAYGAGDRQDFEGLPPFRNNVKDAGYALLNASAGVTLGRGFALSVRGENLLDQDYTTANGYQQSGAAGYAQIRYDWAKAQ
jgi:vitamin B12 transporter